MIVIIFTQAYKRILDSLVLLALNTTPNAVATAIIVTTPAPIAVAVINLAFDVDDATLM
jgi:hypothetical protein